MSLSLIIRPEAEADLRQIYQDLDETRAGLGAQFLAQATKVFERIEATPELYGRVWQDVRAARLRRFRYIVYHVVFADRIEVIAVFHGARDASAWQLRR